VAYSSASSPPSKDSVPYYNINTQSDKMQFKYYPAGGNCWAAYGLYDSYSETYR